MSTEFSPVSVSRSVPRLAREKRQPAERLGVAVVDDLVESIVIGEVGPGDSLPPEGPLSIEFGVSRTVIRESIKRVEEKGLVRVEQGRGTRVTPMSEWNILDPVVLSAMVAHDDSLGILDEVVTVRSAIESEIAGRLAVIVTDGQLDRLRACQQTMENNVEDIPAFRSADVKFHSLVMEFSGSRLGASIARVLVREAMRSDRYHGHPGSSAHVATLAEHARVIEALASRAPVVAKEAMREHIEVAWERRRTPPAARA